MTGGGEIAMKQAKRIEYPAPLKNILRRGLDNPEGLWAEVAQNLHWFKPWQKVLEWKYPDITWFKGGETNLCYNCLDRHVNAGKGEKPAVIYETEDAKARRVLSYSKLLAQVKQLSATLKAYGVKRGDRVTIYMPNIPEALMAMLATTRIGAIHSVVFGGFGSQALADRIIDAGSKILLTTDIGIRKGQPVGLKELADKALEIATGVKTVIVLKRGQSVPPMKAGRDVFWEDALKKGKGVDAEAVPMRADEIAFILYTSGTMAKPKGTVQPHGSYPVYVYGMGKWVYDMKPTDIWFSTSDVGWIVGHSYVVYGPLLHGCTTIMYEGVPDHPAPDRWWEIIEKNKVTKLWISPTGARGLMRYGNDWPKKHNLKTVRAVFCAGEVLNPPAWEWLQYTVFNKGVPVIDHMWQTESSGPMIGNPYGIALLPIKSGSATIPLPGIAADIVDDDGRSLPLNEKGNFVVRKPFPGLTPTLWGDKGRYVKDYWERIKGCYYTGDAAMKDEDGYFWFFGRLDEVIKIAAHRIGTIEIESTLLTHPSVAETAVIGKPDPLKGEVACAFVVLRAGNTPSDDLAKQLRQVVRDALGPIAIVEDILFVSKLPKTRSGKIMRRLLKSAITGEPLGDYSTIEDATAIDEIKKAAEKVKKS
jgi:acetyl-CoA synthetase